MIAILLRPTTPGDRHTPPIRHSLRHTAYLIQELIEAIFTAAVDQLTIRTMTAQEEETAGKAFAVELHHRVDGGAGDRAIPRFRRPIGWLVV